jgi:hypothetical protein
VNDLGADWLEDAETIEELDGVTQDRELSRLVNASLSMRSSGESSELRLQSMRDPVER